MSTPGPGVPPRDPPIVVADYDPRWPLAFAEEAARIREACGGDALAAIEHIGSTAVPGLAAKPIIDIMPGVLDIGRAERLIPAMQSLGYESLGAYGIERRLYFRRGEPRSHHVHMVELGGEFWRRHLLFRDHLRANPAQAAEYARLKRELASRFGVDREGYTAAKTGFIERCLARGGEKA